MRNLKILYITHYADLYGANLSLLAMMQTLRAHYDIKPVVLLNRKGKFIEKLEENNIEYVVSPFYMNKIEMKQPHKACHVMLRKLVTPYLYKKAAQRIKKWGKLSFIHSNSGVINIGDYLADAFGIPHIWHIREYGEEDYSLEDIYAAHYIGERMRKASCVIAISDSIRRHMENKYGELPVKVIYNGIRVPEQYEKRYCKDGIVSFCMAGLVCEGKNQIVALKACAELRKRGKTGFHLYFLGEFGDAVYKEQMESMIAEEGLEPYITFQGYVSDIHSRLTGMDVGIVASRMEAFGRVTLEYMCNYMPVIGSNSGGTSELIRDREDGILYPPGDCGKLADAMENFMEHGELIMEYGKKGRAFAAELTAEKNAENVYGIYNEALAKSEETDRGGKSKKNIFR